MNMMEKYGKVQIETFHGRDFEYEYPDNSTIKVKILKNGDYKINY